jgi:hypothetical protein
MSDKKFKQSIVVEGDITSTGLTPNRALTTDANNKIVESAVTDTELGYVSGVTSSIQTQINSANTAASDAQADIDNHIADTADAHDASAISNVPAGNLAATDVQGALNELQSDVDTRALDSAVIKKDGSVAFTADQSMGGFKLTNLATPTAPTHAATKEYVDNAIEGAKPKEAVRVATTAAINLATDLEAGDVIDGVTLVAGDRVLVKNQAAPEQNGIYVAVASGAASRSTDFDSLSPVDEVNKAYVAVQEGTANQGKIFIQYGNVSTLGTDPVNFTFYNSISGLTGDDGITVSGSSISVDHDGQGLDFSAGQLVLELDGTSLSKSASGLRVAASVLTDISNAQATADNHIADAVDAHDASAISNVPSGNLAATDVQSALNELQGDIDTNATAISDHLADATDAHDASAISNVPAGNLAATDVQAALNELQGDIDTLNTNLSNHLSDTADAHDASAISFVPTGNTTSTDVQAAIEELQTELDNFNPGSAGDIEETSFSLANNQVSAANVTGLAFASGVSRSFEALVSVEIDASSDLYEVFKLYGIQRGADWQMSVESTGDNSLVNFTITSSGQVQYTSGNYAGFVAGLIKFRAIVTSV